MNDSLDPYTQWDAAYVLGALSPAERHEFEAHLASCPRCASAVAELAGMPGLLAGLSQEQAIALTAPESPEAAEDSVADVLPLLAKRARRSKIRRRLLSIGVAAAVAASAVVATVVVVPIVTASEAQAGSVPLIFTAVESQTVTVSGKALPVAWGTQIEWRCSYLASRNTPGYTGGPPSPYQLVVIERNGKETIAASWDASEGTVVSPIATVDIPLADIASVEVRWSDNGKIAVRATL
ncbi:MAG: zf-HC2 domain-containing protein [Renibacterium sp.]|nr:zf-HC2 domain-containing protein [Renibacterium sp.]